MISRELQDEAKAFDARILERVRNGLVPDIRHAGSVDWFFNNPWRRREYVDMIFGDYLRFALLYLNEGPQKILEIGSGLGHMSLELARAGHDVTGLELSPESIRIAREYFQKVGKEANFGSLEYINDDLMDWRPAGSFDAVCIFLTLHHFDSPQSVIGKIATFLKPGGKIIVIEPARDLFTPRNAAIVALIRILLSVNENWYSPLPVPMTGKQFELLANDILNEYQQARDKNEKEQSPNDNSSYATTMLAALDRYFERSALTHGNSISPRLLGGIRGKTEEEALKIATFIKLFDEVATAGGFIEPGVIYYSGKLK